jgi:peroxiredoxin Q/BCP
MPVALKPGDPAPRIATTAQSGEAVSLADYVGKNVVVLYFYPKDNTAICTAEACAFRDSFVDFTNAGAVVMGVSGDSDASHRDFAQKHRLPFLLLSDPDGSIRKAFGVSNTLGLVPKRVTFVIDRQGIIRHVFSALFTADKHALEARKIVEELASN